MLSQLAGDRLEAAGLRGEVREHGAAGAAQRRGPGGRVRGLQEGFGSIYLCIYMFNASTDQTLNLHTDWIPNLEESGVLGKNKC